MDLKCRHNYEHASLSQMVPYFHIIIIIIIIITIIITITIIIINIIIIIIIIIIIFIITKTHYRPTPPTLFGAFCGDMFWGRLCQALLSHNIEIKLGDKGYLTVSARIRLFLPNSYLGSSGVFSPDYLRRDPVQFQRQVPGKVPVRLGEGSGADSEVRFQKVPVGAELRSGSGRFWWIRKVPVQGLGEVLQGSGSDT